MKRYFTILNLLLIIAVIYFGVDVFYKLFMTKKTVTPITLPTNKPSASAGIKVQKERPDYNAISKRNLFNIKTKTLSANKPIKINTLKQTSLKLKLWGTVTGTYGKNYAVIEANSGKQNLHHAGDTVQNATVKAILRKKVVLHVSGKDEILEMEKGSPSNKKNAVRDSYKRTSVQNIPLKRSQVENAPKDIKQLPRQANIRPYFEHRKPGGLMVSGIQPDSIFKKIGLLNRDIITRLNEEPVTSEDNTLTLYENLKASGSVRLEIKRKGRIQMIEYNNN